jgi:small GTP-binding protein
MGNGASKKASKERTLQTQRKKKVVLLGIEGAGKTTLLQKIQYGEPQAIKPTIGFNLENVKTEKFDLMMFDIAGGARSMWSHYLEGADVIIYVFDSSRKDSFELQKELLKMINKEINRENFLFMCALAKSDLKGSMTNQEFLSMTKVYDYIDSDMLIQRVSAVSGEGINELVIKMTDYLSKTSK